MWEYCVLCVYKIAENRNGELGRRQLQTREILVDFFLLQPQGWVRLGKKTQAQYYSSVYTKR